LAAAFFTAGFAAAVVAGGVVVAGAVVAGVAAVGVVVPAAAGAGVASAAGAGVVGAAAGVAAGVVELAESVVGVVAFEGELAGGVLPPQPMSAEVPRAARVAAMCWRDRFGRMYRCSFGVAVSG
jgi:hypothetical protein